jgi:hypothetical protein
MARSITIPDKLPTLESAINLFINWRDNPCELLGGLPPVKLFNYTTDIDRTWFVGSSVWMPAVLEQMPDKDADIDIITQNKESYEILFGYIKATLAEVFPGAYTEETNLYGGMKLKRNNRKIIDVWHLPENQSIAEHIMGFPQAHERCAVMAGISKGDINSITRIVMPNSTKREVPKTRNLLDWGS